MKRFVAFIIAVCLLLPGVLFNMNLVVNADEYESTESENGENSIFHEDGEDKTLNGTTEEENEKKEQGEEEENERKEKKEEEDKREEQGEEKGQNKKSTLKSSNSNSENIISGEQSTVSANSAMGRALTLAGEGTSEKPYQITTAEQLTAFAQDVNSGNDYEGKYVVLTSDIYLNEIDQYDNWGQVAPENQWTPIMDFAGNFDGNQYTIYGMYVSSSSNYVGMFGQIDSETFEKKSVQIKNLHLKNVYIKGSSYVGGIVGEAHCQIDVSNCSVEGKIIGSNSYVGGIGGHFSSGGNKGLALYSNVNKAEISGSYYVGGIWGYASVGNSSGSSTSGNGSEQIIAKDCDNYGSVSGKKSNVGGCLGYLSRSLNCNGFEVERLQNFGEIKGGQYTGGVIGTVYGFTSSSLSHSVGELCNLGDVSGSNYVGGVVGMATPDSATCYIDNVYNTGLVKGTESVGGILGYSHPTWYGKVYVRYSYNLGEVKSQGKAAAVIGGLGTSLLEGDSYVRYCYYQSGTSERSTYGSASNLKEIEENQVNVQSTYSGFDFTNIWKMGEKYPVFRWQNGTPGTGTIDESSQFIIERVKAYTSGEIYAQWDAIFNSDDSYETKFQKFTELFNQYGFLDVREGTKYLSKTTGDRYAYLALTTDEMYCAYNFYDWLHNTAKGAVSRGLLIADGLIFNNELSSWTDLSTYIEGDYPGVVKYKDMLYDFMDETSIELEKMSYISDVSDLAGKATDAGKVYADNLIGKLNACSTSEQLRETMASAEALGVYSDVKTEGTNINNFKMSYVMDNNSGFGKFCKAMGYATQFIDIMNVSVEHLTDMVELNSKLAVYEQYRNFLDEVEHSTDLPLEMRLAARSIMSEMNQGVWGELLRFAVDLMDTTSVTSTISDKVIQTALGKTGSGTLSEYLLVIQIESYFINKIADIGKLVQGVAYVEGYAELSSHYQARLSESRELFLKDPSAGNAWDFYDDYTTLYMLRLKGEQAYLNMSKVEGILSYFTDFGYSAKEEVVKDTIQTLEERCVFALDDKTEIPESEKFAVKAVISCPVNIKVYSPDGTCIATLYDGKESDVKNEYGRFQVIYRPYSGEYAKVISFYQDLNYKLEIEGTDQGLISFALADAVGSDVTIYTIENLSTDKGAVLQTTISQLRNEGTIEIDLDGDGETDNKAQVLINQGDSYIPIENIQLDKDNSILLKGDSILLQVMLTPDTASHQKVSWLSADPGIVEVKEGKIQTVEVGKTSVYCVSQDNTDKMAVCKICVRPANACIHTLTKVDAKQPTTLEDGNIEYWYCPDCEIYYGDSDGLKVLDKKEVILPRLGEVGENDNGNENMQENEMNTISSGEPEKHAAPDTGDENSIYWAFLLAATGMVIAVRRKISM